MKAVAKINGFVITTGLANTYFCVQIFIKKTERNYKERRYDI